MMASDGVSRRIRIFIYTLLFVQLVGLWAFSGYLFIASRTQSESAGPVGAEASFASVIGTEQAVDRTQIDMLKVANGLASADDIDASLQILESRIAQISGRGAMSRFMEYPQYVASVDKVKTIYAEIEAMRNQAGNADTWITPGIAKFDEMRTPLSELEMVVGEINARRRDEVREDYEHRRSMLMGSSIGATIVLLTLAYLFASNARKLRDVSAKQKEALQRETAAALSAANAVNARNAFLGMIGHELRTPLQSIMAATDVLVERNFTGTDKLLIDQLARAANVLEAQMKDLTDFSRMEAGQLALRKRIFNPYGVLNAAVESVSERARRKSLALRLEFDDWQVKVLSDPFRIQQIVTNLLDNAIKYADRGSVTLRASLERLPGIDRLSVDVIDTGRGIDRVSQEQIFQPFTQIDTPESKRVDGIGMGLTIVRGLVELLGAKLSLESEVGKGSKFTVVFDLEHVTSEMETPGTEPGATAVTAPLEAAAMAGSPAMATARTSGAPAAVEAEPDVSAVVVPAGQTPRRVLVIDDQADVRHTIEMLLRVNGIECESVSNAREAYRLVERTPYDAIMLDLNMPEVDGVSAAMEIRRMGGINADVPLIAFSAQAPEVIPAHHLSLFEHYLMKPVRGDILRVVLESIWATRGVGL
ncbi:hybrid sensor histidine kinase/response regulator [Pandoraea pnomenusa]|nr:ATP-binding protein [Pandoraea pnomenusa]